MIVSEGYQKTSLFIGFGLFPVVSFQIFRNKFVSADSFSQYFSAFFPTEPTKLFKFVVLGPVIHFAQGFGCAKWSQEEMGSNRARRNQSVDETKEYTLGF